MSGILCQPKNFPDLVETFLGSSRKVRERNRKKPDKSEEEVIIPIPISEALGNFGLVVKALKFASRDGIGGMSEQAIYRGYSVWR